VEVVFSLRNDIADRAPNAAGAEGRQMQPAIDETQPAALPLPLPTSTGDELLQMGILYSTGQGGAPLDYVSAHMLFNLAAMRGSEEARRWRRELSAEMDRDTVAEAQRAAREWLSAA
jgi:TPR repeat protein